MRTQKISPEVRASAARIASMMRLLSACEIIGHQLPEAPPPPNEPPPPEKPPPDESDQEEPEEPELHDDPESDELGTGTKTGPPRRPRPARLSPIASRHMVRKTQRKTSTQKMMSKVSKAPS